MAGRGRKNADGVLATAFATGATIAGAAAQAGVSERTAYRRLKDPAFRLRIAGTEAAMIARTVTRLADASSIAVDTLTVLLLPENPPFIRFVAAKQLVAYTLQVQDSKTTQARLIAVEEALGQVVGELRAVAQQVQGNKDGDLDSEVSNGHRNGQGSPPAAPALPERLLARMGALDPAVAVGLNGHVTT